MLTNIEGILSFIKELDLLKSATRTAWTAEGRRESVAEHSWRLAMFALALREGFQELDAVKVLEMCLIHDLGEAYEGDVPATVEEEAGNKLKREEIALRRMTATLGEQGDHYIKLWQEYNEGETGEARLVKALDKMETILQHNQGKNPKNFDYAFNLEYGRKWAMEDERLKLIRSIIDGETQARI